MRSIGGGTVPPMRQPSRRSLPLVPLLGLLLGLVLLAPAAASAASAPGSAVVLVSGFT